MVGKTPPRLLDVVDRRVLEEAGRGLVSAGPGALAARALEALPFQLTEDQRNALREIVADLRSPRPMHRLLIGEVGSGKTVVALLAALHVIEAGHQVAFMAPTEILARQHFATIARLCTGTEVPLAVLTAATPAKERRALLARLEAGEALLALVDEKTFRTARACILKPRFGAADFVGGAEITYPVSTPVTADQVQSVLDKYGLTGEVQLLAGGDQVSIRTDSLGDLQDPTAFRQDLADQAGIQAEQVNVEDIGPTWGQQISRKAIRGLVLVLFFIGIYIAWRFQWSMAIGAMVALGHADTTLERFIGFFGVMLSAGNAVGGYVVTDRMLEMFKSSKGRGKH